MTKDEIYNAVCDMAEDAGVDPGELIGALRQQNEELFEKSFQGLSAPAESYLKSARDGRKAAREKQRKSEREGLLAEDVKRFRRLFPKIGAESIPESVWKDMQRGIPLPYAYALYAVTGEDDSSYAESVNARNSGQAAPAVCEGDENGEISQEEVESMSPSAVKKNFPRILKSLGKWKI